MIVLKKLVPIHYKLYLISFPLHLFLKTLNRKEMKNDSNADSCISRDVTDLPPKFAFHNEGRGGWNKFWRRGGDEKNNGSMKSTKVRLFLFCKMEYTKHSKSSRFSPF